MLATVCTFAQSDPCGGTGKIRCMMCSGTGVCFGFKCPGCMGAGYTLCSYCEFMKEYKKELERTKNMTKEEKERDHQLKMEQLRRNQMILDEINGSRNGSSSSGSSMSCPNCRGTGKCSYCGGSGWSPAVYGKRCIQCNGSGRCSGPGSCHGTGKIR